MNELNEVDKTILSIIDTIQTVIINEIGSLIYPDGKNNDDVFKQSSPYIKFLPIITSIEFLGACYDELPFYATRLDKEDIVEKRFNTAIKNLFGKQYLQFVNANNEFYFYKKLRCAMIHQLKPGEGLYFTTRYESKNDGVKHLMRNDTGLFLVLEDFYDDLKKASNKLINNFQKGKTTNKKGELPFLEVITIE